MYELNKDIIKVARKLPTYFDIIIGIGNGGIIPMMLVNSHLNIHQKIINYSSKSGFGDDKTHDNIIPDNLIDDINFKSVRVLVVDDIADSGKTLNEVVDILKKNRKIMLIETFVVHHKDKSAHTPTYSVFKIPHDAPWINYWWEL